MLSDKAVNFTNEAILLNETKKTPAHQTTDGRKSATIFRRIADAEMTAARECLDRHGNLVWALAKKFTASTEEAETAAQEIFLDIWKCAARFDSVDCEEADFIILVVQRWRLKRMYESVFVS